MVSGKKIPKEIYCLYFIPCLKSECFLSLTIQIQQASSNSVFSNYKTTYKSHFKRKSCHVLDIINIIFTSNLDTFATRAKMYVYISFTVIANVVQI